MTQREPTRIRPLQAKALDRRSIATSHPFGAGLPGAGLPGAGLPGAGLPEAGLPEAGAPGRGRGLEQRLRNLSEIGQVLGRDVPTDRVLPTVAAIVERELPLRAMVLVTGARRGARSVVWSRRDTGARELRVARSHALRWSSYLAGAATWSATDLWDAGPDRPRLARAARRMRGVVETALTMPVGAADGAVLGALLLETADGLGEDDLVFLQQVATLFATAIERERARAAPIVAPEGDAADLAPAIDGAVEGVVTVDVHGRVNFVSSAARHLLGCPTEVVLGRDVHELLTFVDDGRGSSASPVTELLAGGRSSGESVARARARAAGPLDVSVVPLLSSARATTGAVLVLRDAEIARRSERTQRSLALSATALVTSLDPDETLEAIGRLPVPALADVCSIDRIADDGSVESRPAIVTHDLERAASWTIVRRGASADWESPQRQVLRRGETLFCSDVHDTVVTCGGARGVRAATDVPIASMVVVPLKARGRLLGAMTFAMTDSGRRFAPSDLRDLEEVAQRAAHALENASLFKREQMAARSREDILAVVSHDLRNPLGVVIGGAALLLEMPTGDERRRRLVQAIQRAAQRMRRLIGDLLDASCLDGGRLSMEIARQPADQLVHDAVEMVSHPPPGGRQLRFVADAEAVAGAAVVCDRDRILQVFSNLIGNAIDFTPDGGTIRIGARREGDDVVFYVADTGPGIAPEHLPHVFERFWQLRRAPGPRKGLGLGLPIAQGIVETHGGRIWAESVEGTGSTFYFSLHAVLTTPRGA